MIRNQDTLKSIQTDPNEMFKELDGDVMDESDLQIIAGVIGNAIQEYVQGDKDEQESARSFLFDTASWGTGYLEQFLLDHHYSKEEYGFGYHQDWVRKVARQYKKNGVPEGRVNMGNKRRET